MRLGTANVLVDLHDTRQVLLQGGEPLTLSPLMPPLGELALAAAIDINNRTDDQVPSLSQRGQLLLVDVRNAWPITRDGQAYRNFGGNAIVAAASYCLVDLIAGRKALRPGDSLTYGRRVIADNLQHRGAVGESLRSDELFEGIALNHFDITVNHDHTVDITDFGTNNGTRVYQGRSSLYHLGISSAPLVEYVPDRRRPFGRWL